MNIKIAVLSIIFFQSLLFGSDLSEILRQSKNNSKFSASTLVNDSLKIKALSDSCWKYRSNDPEKALQFGLEALKLTKETGINKYKSRILSFIGVVYRNIGDLEKALIFY